MKASPRIGSQIETRFIVEPKHAIEVADDVMPAVLSTPWLIRYLEHAALDAVVPYLEEGETTVGVNVEVEHLAPTPVGQEVTCRARIINADGTLISFQLEASDRSGPIARGLHKRRVIEIA